MAALPLRAFGCHDYLAAAEARRGLVDAEMCHESREPAMPSSPPLFLFEFIRCYAYAAACCLAMASRSLRGDEGKTIDFDGDALSRLLCRAEKGGRFTLSPSQIKGFSISRRIIPRGVYLIDI